VFMQKNPGFLILYSFIKDALLSKVGIVKVWWEETEREERETYFDLTDEQFAIIVSDPAVDVIEHSQTTEDGAQRTNANTVQAGGDLSSAVRPPSSASHDVTIRVRKRHCCARVEGVPPEEFGIARNARTIRDCSYCFHEVVRREAELIAAGYDA